jgi:hypothetical protein
MKMLSLHMRWCVLTSLAAKACLLCQAVHVACLLLTVFHVLLDGAQWAAEQAAMFEMYGSDDAADSDSDYEHSSKRRKQQGKKGGGQSRAAGVQLGMVQYMAARVEKSM